MEQSLEYCSLHYLNMWLKYDRGYYIALKKGSDDEKLSSLKKATHYYKISRNLPSEFDEGKNFPRYKPVLNILESLTRADVIGRPLDPIIETENRISEVYGGRGTLSLTTKLLWLKMRDPIIIYDKEVRTALGTPDGDLPSYYEAWKQEYKNYEDQISSVCAKLSKISKYSYNNIPAERIEKLSSKRWFKKRVFDVYLWHKAPRKKPSTKP